MTIASGVNVQLLQVEEVTHGTTPGSPGMDVMRLTGKNINLTKAILESDELRDSRQKSDLRHGFQSVVGSFPFELSRANFDASLYYLLGDDAAVDGDPGPLAWNDITEVDNVVSITLASGQVSTITRASGDFLADGWRPGMTATTAGFAANNNGDFFILAVVALTITIHDPLNVTTVEAAAAGKTLNLSGGFIESGSRLQTVTFERGFTDVTQFQPFRGCTYNGMTLSIQPERIIGGTFDILGMSAGAMSGTSLDASPTAAVTSSPFDAFTGVMMEGGAVVAVVTGLELNVVNNRSVLGVIGSPTSPDVFEGQHIVTGTVTAWFENATQYNKFVNETETSLAVKLDDPDGINFHCISLPRLKYTGADMDPPQEGPIPVVMPFQALEKTHSGVASTITWQKSNA